MLQPSPLATADFSAKPQIWSADSFVRKPGMALQPDDPLAGFDRLAYEDPVAAELVPLEMDAADWLPDSRSVPNSRWTAPAVRLPGASRGSSPKGSLKLCGAAGSLMAEVVEAFLPLTPEPQTVPYTSTAIYAPRWGLRAVDWVVAVDLAGLAAVPVAEAVESLLPPAAEPQMLAWPIALPPLALRATELTITAAMADFLEAPAAETVESLLPTAAEPQIAAWPIALPPLALAAVDWTVTAAMADFLEAPAAETVESFLPPAAEPQIVAWPIAVPPLSLTAAEWTVTAAMADFLEAPAAEAVESFLPAAVEPQIVAWPAAAAILPRLTLGPASWVLSVDIAEPVAAPAAQAAETFLPPPAEPEIVTWPAALPPLALAAADWTVTATAADFVEAPAAQAAETFLPLPAEPQIVSWPAAAALLPRLTLGPASWALSVDIAGPVAAPAAQAAETFLPSPAEPRIATWPGAATILPRVVLSAVDWVLAAAMAEPVAAPAAQPVESLLPPAAEPMAIPLGVATSLPALQLIAAEMEPLEEFVPPVVVAGPSESWMPSLPACEAEREVSPRFFGALPVSAAPAAPAALALALTEPAIRWAGNWRQSAAAEPVAAFIRPRLEMALPVAFEISAPSFGALQKTSARRAQSLAAPAAGRYPEAAEPATAKPAPTATAAAVYSGLPPVLHLPTLAVEQATANQAAPFHSGDMAASEPAAGVPDPGSAVPRDPAAKVQVPPPPAALLRCGLPLAKQKGMDFICQRTTITPVKSLESIPADIPVLAPRFVVRPLFERLEEAVAPPKPVEKTPAFAEIFAIRRAARRHYSAANRGLFSAGKLIAASLIVGLSMWFGAGSVKISRQLLAINTTIRDIGAGPSSNVGDVSPAPASGFPAPGNSAPKAPGGPIAALRRAIQSRAAVEFTDTFRRVESWGASAMTMPAGWSRHPDGYVRAGQLALYRPAQSFTDYSFEFFGEIERKSMSWAVRASDTQNYYAMKMTVIEPGLRPVVAVVHYAVVGGKKGQRVETPLSIMMHNHEPYHIAVNVKGNRVITSIEGQEVDSFTDDALKVGGIGFFAEAGESAKLYWMRVSKNQDWLGRVCSYLSSGSGANTADLWRGGPQAPTEPPEPALPPVTDAALAAAEETEEFSHIGPHRARILKDGRTELCRS